MGRTPSLTPALVAALFFAAGCSDDSLADGGDFALDFVVERGDTIRAGQLGTAGTMSLKPGGALDARLTIKGETANFAGTWWNDRGTLKATIDPYPEATIGQASGPVRVVLYEVSLDGSGDAKRSGPDVVTAWSRKSAP